MRVPFNRRLSNVLDGNKIAENDNRRTDSGWQKIKKKTKNMAEKETKTNVGLKLEDMELMFDV